MKSPDFVIVGSGIGGATLALALAPSGADILILERGHRLKDTPETRNLDAIFGDGFFRSSETWLDGQGTEFSPGNFYNVGGNSKFYGAVMYRYRESDFEERQLPDGKTQAWPFKYAELEPWYGMTEQLFQIRGEADVDPSDPPRSTPFPHGPVPYEPQISDAADRLRKMGLHPTPLPLALDLDKWLARSKTPWDGVPDTFTGKIDAETGPLQRALAYENVKLETGATATRLETGPDGKRIEKVHYAQNGEQHELSAAKVVLALGAVNSAILLQRSEHPNRKGGLANSSDAVGRYFMNHNTTAMITYDMRKGWDTIYSKSFGLNDYYLKDPETGLQLGNVQQLG
ncbi:MAG: GMC family oxidoreductase, partial [Rhodobacteraceae bacterium]|nr:GMC family oxidoreductase [Paracoccaceae bacterium]